MLVYILGEANSGKSTASQFLQVSYGFVEVSLADPMKRFAQDMFGFSDEQLWGESANRNAPDPRFPRHEAPSLSPRDLLQGLGEGMRTVYPDIWIHKLLETAQELGQGGVGYHPTTGLFAEQGRSPANCIIPDVRYRNEHEALRSAGGIGIRLKSLRQGQGLTKAQAAHISEVEQRSIPDAELFTVIENNGTLQDFYHALSAKITEHCKIFTVSFRHP